MSIACIPAQCSIFERLLAPNKCASVLTLTLFQSSFHLFIWDDTLPATEAFQIFQISRQCMPRTVQSASLSSRHYTSKECVCGNEDWIFPFFLYASYIKFITRPISIASNFELKWKNGKHIVAVGCTVRPNITVLLLALIGCSESTQSCRGRAHSPDLSCAQGFCS